MSFNYLQSHLQEQLRQRENKAQELNTPKKMASFLPSHDGLLPLCVLLVGVTALGNAIQAYTTLSYTRRLYAGQPPSSRSVSTKTTKTTTTTTESTSPPADARPSVTSRATSDAHTSPATPLSSRTFGTWTFAVGLVRIYAAYHINEEAWYQMNMWTNVIGLFHFGAEAFVYKTARPYGPWLAPVIVALIGLTWSAAQYSYYVK